ncbi:hypothetical protein CEUSTIGMA_g3655.t1 [Chlamydomonas eustigma]|uniref:Heterogeneous nuclear ribonucleoprotein Q acidic domain-containing protein n=1 Tax=Chlamydomonas eustigma TaxID=1157962 RepID=A0A250WZF3_9CHLO|nr:hypothetical protein CEUSTIGMA_g3655.t1 [Chlamydomonas eustigma]|eukprot:GAX76211.1 hypothetical protein CEUSTIGMA_g3655.t1 [Chlamydomonas eustigma]
MSENGKRPAELAELTTSAKLPRLSGSIDTLDSSVRQKLESLIDSRTITEGDIDDRALSELSEFNARDGLEILRQFETAAEIKNVRNKSAYLHGVMTRHRQNSGPRLDREVDARLEKLFRITKIKHGDFDGRAYDELAALPPHAAVRAIDKFQSKVSDDVRNLSAFFTSIIRQEAALGGPRHFDGVPGPRDSHGGHRDGLIPRDRDFRDERLYLRDRGATRHMDSYDRLSHSLDYRGPHHNPAPRHAHPIEPKPHLAIPPVLGGQTMLSNPSGQQIFILNPGSTQQGGGTVSIDQLSQILAAVQPQQTPKLSTQHAHGRVSFGVDQAQLGVRTDEFHDLSVFAEFVRPAAALKLQMLWDQGNRLVSLLDDRSWELLAELPPAEALVVVEETASKIIELKNLNAYFSAKATNYLPRRSREAQPSSRHVLDEPPAPRMMPIRSASASTSYHPPSSSSRGAGGGRRDGHGVGGGIDALPERLQESARQAIVRHRPLLEEGMFDEGVVGYLKRLSEEEGLDVFEELINADLSSVRNMPAYLMGMIKKRKNPHR